METHMLCRVCFEVGHFSMSGYEVNVQGDNISIEKMVQRFSDIELVEGNSPEMICESCTHDLVQSYLFVDKIQQADARILNLFSEQSNESTIFYEEDVLSQKDPVEAKDEEEEELIQDSQDIEERFSDEDETIQPATEEDASPNIVEEIYMDEDDGGECQEEHNEPMLNITPDKMEDNKDGIVNFLPSWDIVKEVPEEPKRKTYCRRREKRNREIDGSESFVITQFTSATASRGQLENMIADDTDDIMLSDIRTMNFETVEVNAGNISANTEARHGELPIDETRVYLCQYCPKAFSSSSFLIAHVRKSHGCKYCAKMFNKSTELYKHIRETHTSFKCLICEKDFVSNSNLRNHMKIIHKLKVPANVSLLSYKKGNNDSCIS